MVRLLDARLDISPYAPPTSDSESPIIPARQPLGDSAAEYDLPIVLHMEAVIKNMPAPSGLSTNNPPYLKENISAFERLLNHNPKTRIVWVHIGWDNTGGKTTHLIRRLLKQHPNLYCALRVEERLQAVGGTPMPDRIVDNNWRIKDEWLHLFKEFPDRFVVGSDEFFGIPGQSPKAPQSFEETWRTINQLPGDLAYKIGRQNVLSIYNLE